MIAPRTIPLSARQDKAIIALLNEATVARASAISGIPERTFYNWLSDPDFSAAYHRHRREAFGQAVAMTQRYAPLAVNTLAKIMQDDSAPHHARVTAAATMLRFGREGIELDDLAQRVDALEQAARRASQRERTIVDILGRVKRLEREYGSRLACPVCGGRGRHVVSEVHPGDPEPTPEGCPHCGEIMHYILRYVEEHAMRVEPCG